MFNFVRVHSEKGLTDLSFTDDGSHFVTCGQDGDIHLFNLDANQDQVEHIRCAEHCSSIVVHENHLFVGTDRNELEVRSYPDGDSLPSLAHFTQPVSTLLRFNSSILVGTRDFRLLMINLTSDVREMKSFDGHEGPILSLSVHPQKKLLCSSCCDGNVRIFNLDDGQLVKQLKNLFPKSNDLERSPSLVRTDWDTVDQLLSIPVKNSVHFYEIDQWTKKKTYENASIDQSIHQIVYSPCRTLFILSYANGQLCVVNRSNWNVLANHSHTEAICSIKWNPKSPSRFICTTFNGEYSHGNVDEYLSKPSDPLSGDVSMDVDLSSSTTKTKKKKKINLIEDEDDEDEPIDEEEPEEEVVVEEEEKPKREKRRHESAEMFDESSLLLLMEKLKPELQEPFQVTSTSKYLESRYLVLNSVGMICCYNEQIQIKFHDVSHHHSITIDNKTKKYALGDLSSKCVLLASEETNEFFSLFYASWDTATKEFHFHLDKPDRIQLIKLTDDFLVLLTQQKLIRLFTLSGIQQRIVRFQGPPLALSSFQNQLFLLQHSAQGIGKEPCVSFAIIDLDDDRQSSGLLPLASKSKVTWIGYSDSGRCYYAEKSGHLSLLRRTRTNEYQSVLVANLKDEAEKNHLSAYWMIGLADLHGKLQVRVVELRHQSYPDVHPPPLINIISPSIPLLNIDAEQTPLENEYLKLKLFVTDPTDEDQQNEERQCLIKMFANSCKANREYRALEICHLMDPLALQLAMKYATKSGKLTLAQMISDQFIEENSSFQRKQKEKEKEKEKETREIEWMDQPAKSVVHDDVPLFLDSTTTKSKVELSKANSFQNPFRRKMGQEQQQQQRKDDVGQSKASADELSGWKPSLITKSKLSSTGKCSSSPVPNVPVDENDDPPTNGKRKISEEKDDEPAKEILPNKRNKLRQFLCEK